MIIIHLEKPCSFEKNLAHMRKTCSYEKNLVYMGKTCSYEKYLTDHPVSNMFAVSFECLKWIETFVFFICIFICMLLFFLNFSFVIPKILDIPRHLGLLFSPFFCIRGVPEKSGTGIWRKGKENSSSILWRQNICC